MLVLLLKLLLNPSPFLPRPPLFLPHFKGLRPVHPRGPFYRVFHSLGIKIFSNCRRLAKNFGFAAGPFAEKGEVSMRKLLCKVVRAALQNIADLVKHEFTPGCDAVLLLQLLRWWQRSVQEVLHMALMEFEDF